MRSVKGRERERDRHTQRDKVCVTRIQLATEVKCMQHIPASTNDSTASVQQPAYTHTHTHTQRQTV